MNFDDVKKIPIIDWLEQVEGQSPVKFLSGGVEAVYYSTFREDDKNPSLVINTLTQLFIDNGTGKQGIYLSEYLKIRYNVFGKELLQLVGTSIFGTSKSQQQYNKEFTKKVKSSPLPQEKKQKKSLQLVANNDLKHQALINYLVERKVTPNIYKKYFREIHYLTTSGKNMFGVGFKSGDGFAVSNKLSGGKSFVGEHSSFTHLNPGATEEVLVFEGFMDGMSFISKFKKYMNHSIIVLNSTAEAKNVIGDLKQYSKISLWLDNDLAGNTATEIIFEHFPEISIDYRKKLKPFNDVNNWILGYEYKR